MKRTVSATIGSRAFLLEEDAYAELLRYLDALKRAYKNEQDLHEIIRDIEDRIADYLWEWRGAQGMAITIEDVLRVKAQIGDPADFSDTYTPPHRNCPPRAQSKKLYRDPDNKVFGGVCSGLSYYFNIDVVLVRIVAIVLLFVAFASFWVYIVLWIVLPKAITRAQRLEMRGIPVTPENLNKYC